MNGAHRRPAIDRPHVLVNMAMTADGKIATANRAVSSFGSRRDHDHLLELRATADAVMCGATTAGTPHVSLGPGPKRLRDRRKKRGLAEYNLRVIVSGSGRIDVDADVFRRRFSPILVLTSQDAPDGRLKRLRGVAAEVAGFGKRDLDLSAALQWLRRRWNVRRLVCEGGGELNEALFRSGLVDELHLTLCPRVFGGRTAPTVAEGSGFAQLRDATRLDLRSARRVGEEMFLVYDVIHEPTALSRGSTHRAMSQRRSASRLK